MKDWLSSVLLRLGASRGMLSQYHHRLSLVPGVPQNSSGFSCLGSGQLIHKQIVVSGLGAGCYCGKNVRSF